MFNKRMNKRVLYAEIENLLELTESKISDLGSLGLGKEENENLAKSFKQVYHALENVQKAKKKGGF